MTALRLLWGKVVCAVLRKHKRGVRTNVLAHGLQTLGGTQGYYCPRCGATWTRPARKAKGAGNG